MDSVYYGAASNEDLQAAIEAANLSYRVEDNGFVTFILKNTEILKKSFIQTAELEITDPSGKVRTIELLFRQSKTAPDVYWCYAETKYEEKDISGLTVEAYFEGKGFSRCHIASLDD